MGCIHARGQERRPHQARTRVARSTQNCRVKVNVGLGQIKRRATRSVGRRDAWVAREARPPRRSGAPARPARAERGSPIRRSGGKSRLRRRRLRATNGPRPWPKQATRRSRPGRRLPTRSALWVPSSCRHRTAAPSRRRIRRRLHRRQRRPARRRADRTRCRDDDRRRGARVRGRPALARHGRATCHMPPKPSPVCCPGFASPENRYSGRPLYVH